MGGYSLWRSLQLMADGNDIDRNYQPKLSADKLLSIGRHSTDTFDGRLSVAPLLYCRSLTVEYCLSTEVSVNSTNGISQKRSELTATANVSMPHPMPVMILPEYNMRWFLAKINKSHPISKGMAPTIMASLRPKRSTIGPAIMHPNKEPTARED